MSIRSRVAALERTTGICGPCATCGGRGANSVILRGETSGAKPQPLAEPEGCPECGRVGHVTRIVLVDRSAPRELSMNPASAGSKPEFSDIT